LQARAGLKKSKTVSFQWRKKTITIEDGIVDLVGGIMWANRNPK